MSRPKKWEQAHTHTVRISDRAEKVWRASGLSFGDWVETLLGRKDNDGTTPAEFRLRNLRDQLKLHREKAGLEEERLILQINALEEQVESQAALSEMETKAILEEAKGGRV